MADLNDKLQDMLADCGGDPTALRAAFKKVVGRDGTAKTSKVRELRAALDSLMENHCSVGMTIKMFRREATAAWKRTHPDDDTPIANPYLQFCKDNLASVKASHPDLSYKEHRALLTTMWNEEKGKEKEKTPEKEKEKTPSPEPIEPIVEQVKRPRRTRRNILG